MDPKEETLEERVEKATASRIAKWLMQGETGARYGSNSWLLRQSLAKDIEVGMWKFDYPVEGPR